MNVADRFVYWLITHTTRRHWHQSFPHRVKVVLNRWMKHRGDPGDAV
jgi:hypothetical protein